ncbi:bifunctional UDP-N-acetylmuramoyl-tripeptide:D-alanyl-D-alanine ligase/alanine racemase [Adhaeribacter radiodurans]|uniref:Alanine racemase n=1 Tax=Adhaeribacter radiodurans TaxID=2745197 RepID=A0A7L7LEM9_9BACT|nr:bifunctional UDP-N-acetylmuramoyl-tripeptide:D-alanyl-D-alanine ligase/alanine racemase [Adhaeribacter radiodurans]QMU31134.1 bifunctional UDP-N-acetylmuramoyl-tripeptide:D-alanyl-D-alanine ligase/alanine racemase [Adhaeribacter radiodurans]
MLRFQDLADLTHGNLLQLKQDYLIQYLLTDSRKLAHPASSLFFAIKGVYNNGHQYIANLYKRGVRQFVIEESNAIPGVKQTDALERAFPEANFLQVNSSLAALQKLTAYHRSQFSLPVIAITGSNGKTIVKEWLAQLLSPDERVVKSPRSYNSQIGVPLSVWQINQNHTLGIFEAGISRMAEMEKLAAVIQPTEGIFTNIGQAHAQGFESVAQKITEKLKLFQNVERLYYCLDHVPVHEAVVAANIPAFTWSRHQSADLQIVNSALQNNHFACKFKYQQQTGTLLIPFTDEASIENCLHCLAVLLVRQVPLLEIQQRFLKLTPVAMRLEMKEAINNCYLLDDSYNNDLSGLSIALDVLQNQTRTVKKSVILSDLLESGLSEEVLYSQVAELIRVHRIDRLVGIGPVISRHKLKFELPAEFFADTNEFLEKFNADNYRQETILLKGARVFEFEKIVSAFQRKVHGTVLEVNLDALVHNLNFYRAKLAPETKLMVMVKAFAYGSGSYEIANLLQFHRVDYLTVAYPDEGISLRGHGISLPIMVMSPSPDSFTKLQQYKLEPEIYSLEILEACMKALPSDPSYRQNIHLKLDTGMHRLGFTETDLEPLFARLEATPQLRVISAFSHLAGADEAMYNDFSQLQISRFRAMVQQVENRLGYKVIKHILNSAGIVRFPEHQMDMVRLGIGLYGVEATGMEQDALRTVGQLKTTISQVKAVASGETVGYSRKGIADEPKQIATIAIGYADGYDRRFGNGVGQVLIKKQKAVIIGNICMDMCMLDVTGLDVKAGDEVEVFGENITIGKMARKIGTIPYELLTNISGRVKRVFFAEL